MVSNRFPQTIALSRFTLHMLGDLLSSARSQASLGITLTVRAEIALSGWIPVDTRGM